MKKALKLTGIAVAAPILVFLLLASVLSIPAVQDYVVDKTTGYLKEATGLDVHIDRIRLAFPIDLALHQVYVSKNDSMVLDAGSFRARIALWPLLGKHVVVNGIELYNTRLDTRDLVSDTGIKGSVKALTLKAHDVDLNVSKACIDDILLEKANLDILLSDTAKEDTTPSKNTWIVAVERARIVQSSFRIQMPGDSMRVGADIPAADLRGGLFDLGKHSYGVARLTLKNAGATYDIPYEKPLKTGFDMNHMKISELTARVDSFSFSDGTLSTKVRNLSFKEKSGFETANLSGRIDCDDKQLTVSGFSFTTPHSNLIMSVSTPWSAWKNPVRGTMTLSLDGAIDKRDMLPFATGDAVRSWVECLPDRKLNAHVVMSGSKDNLRIRELKLALPSAFSMAASGDISALGEKNMGGNVNFSITTQNINFIKKPAGLADGDIRFPQPMHATGRIAFSGSTYGVRLNGRVSRGSIRLNGRYNEASGTYQGQVAASQFPVSAFMPGLAACNFTGRAKLSGNGFDIFSRSTSLQASVSVDRLRYDTLLLGNLNLDARLKRGSGTVNFMSDNDILKGSGQVLLSVNSHKLEARLASTIDALNMRKFVAGDDSLLLSSTIDIAAHTDKNYKNYGAKGDITNLQIHSRGNSYRTKDLGFHFANRSDTIFAFVKAGDLDAGMAARGSIEGLTASLTNFIATAQRQINGGKLDRAALRRMLPDMGVRIRSGRDNPVANYLKYSLGYEMSRLDLNLRMTPKDGIDGHGLLTGLNTGSFMLDSTRIRLFEDSTGLKAAVLVLNNAKSNPYHFEARLNGYLNNDKAGFDAVYKDPQGKEGINVGSEVEFLPEGIRLHLYPEHPVLAYRNFTINSNNYIFLKKESDISADVNLLADDGTGLKIYSNEDDSIPDVTLSVSRLNLGELTAALPYLPRLSGHLSGDVHVQKLGDVLSAMSDLRVEKMEYEGCPLGNIEMEFSYLPDEGMTEHFVDALILREDTAVAQVVGKYLDKDGGTLDMDLTLTQFPMSLLDGFTGGVLGFKGAADGTLKLTGAAGAPIMNGSVTLDSLRLYSDVYGFDLHTDSQTLNIDRSTITLPGVNLYSQGDSPLTVKGQVDFSRLDKISMALSMSARNFEIINSKKTDKSEVYGKVLADYTGTVSGTTSDLKVRGRLSVLGESEAGYVLKDTPLSVEDRLSDLVTFVDFRDSTRATQAKSMPDIMGMDILMSINISNAAQVHCELSSDGQSYLDVEGGGNLTMKYTPDGTITLTGRYTVNSGEMKYTLPVIPLRTFQLVSGSYIDFTGDPMNPTLNIQAQERVRASVNDDNNPRSVAFDVGVNITKQLDDMGLEFTIEAPEDGTVQNQLAAISREQRGKLAVSMLVTGMYLAENNSAGGFTASNALNAFLQSEIQQIAGNALKTVDLSFNVDNGTASDGSGQTDYSFRFAKRFWGNRVSFIIGGRVSSGSEAQSNSSFIDNVSLEYRLDSNASRYVRLYYDNQSNDPLEGRLSELGGGIVLRRKASTFGNLFIFGHRKKK